MKAEGIFVDNTMEGERKFFRETGQLWQVGNFTKGEKNGSWERYQKNRQLKYQTALENDKLVK